MFTRQAPNIAESLFLSGLPQASVAAAQNLLGQCRAFIEHRGPIRFDYTNPLFRLIPSSAAPINNHGSGPPPEDFPPEEPGPEEEEIGDDPLNPRRPQNPTPVEHDPIQQPPLAGPGEGDPGDPGRAGGGREYRAGSYIGITKRYKTVSVLNDDQRRHAVWPSGLSAAGEIGSVDYRSEARDELFKIIPRGGDNSFIELEIQDRPRESLWRLYVKNLKLTTFVTAVNYDSESSQIVIEKKSAWVFNPQEVENTYISLVDVEYLTDATLGASTLDFTKKTAKVIAPEEDAETVSIPLAECPAP
jgi:hypothetical protein